MSKVRVLVVDDSAVIRHMLRDILTADPDIEVVGLAPNAATALQKIREAQPDVVTLDVEMPDVSGLELLEEIRQLAPRLPVIMFSSLTQRAAATTLDALARGATDYVTKPAGTGSREASIEHVRNELVPKIKVLGRHTSRSSQLARVIAPTSVVAPRLVGDGLEIVAVGSSTGGPNALVEVFKSFPGDFPVPVVVTQHMPPLFTKLLAERLSGICKLPFREAEHGDVLEPGKVYIAPGDFHMRVVRQDGLVKATLDKEPPENSCRPSVDVLFRSVALAYGARCLSVVLTGMGQDGLKGCELVRQKGGQVVAQDEASSVVWGMPGFVVKAGLADAVLPISDIGRSIVQRVMQGRHSGMSDPRPYRLADAS